MGWGSAKSTNTKESKIQKEEKEITNLQAQDQEYSGVVADNILPEQDSVQQFEAYERYVTQGLQGDKPEFVFPPKHKAHEIYNDPKNEGSESYPSVLYGEMPTDQTKGLEYGKQREPIHFSIGMDYSNSSQNALIYILRDFTKPGDHITAVHIFKDQENASAMQNGVEILLMSFLPSANYLVMFEQKKIQYSSVQAINYVNYIKPHLLALGFHGCHGSEKLATDLGSTVKHALENARCSLMLFRMQYKKPRRLKWLTLVDGSAPAYRAFEMTLNLVDKNWDRVIIVNVITIGETPKAEIRHEYQEYLVNLSINGAYFSLQTAGNLYEAVVKYINEFEAFDFICMGRTGLDGTKNPVGSMVYDMMLHSSANFLIAK